MMTDRPIIFSGPMVSALLEGRKAQTRRLAWGPRFQKAIDDEGGPPGWRWGIWKPGMCAWPGKSMLTRMGLPADADMLIGYMAPSEWQKAQPGDRLWVRENFTTGFEYDDDDKPVGERLLIYAATYQFGQWFDPDKDEWRDQPRWTPSIHMPRSASRLTLVVSEVRRMWLQNISEEDARAEGIGDPYLGDGDPPFEERAVMVSRRTQFRNLWNRLHGAGTWDANPEVVPLSFQVAKINIGQLDEVTP